jgi:hypothetical protein
VLSLASLHLDQCVEIDVSMCKTDELRLDVCYWPNSDISDHRRQRLLSRY